MLRPGEYLQTGDTVFDSTGYYYLTLKYGFVELRRGPAIGTTGLIWSSPADPYVPVDDYFAIMQGDGNFVIYKGTDPSHNRGYVWGTQTQGAPNRFSLQCTLGNLQVGDFACHPPNLGWQSATTDPSPPTPVIRYGTNSSRSQLADFVRGVKALKANGLYDQYVERHRTLALDPQSGIHSAPFFLPWHRLFLWDFEAQLKLALGNPAFTIPYWDWTQYDMFPTSDPLWSASNIGGAGNPVSTGPFAAGQWATIEGPPNLIRELDFPGHESSFPSYASVWGAMDSYDFTNFTNATYGGPHGYIHNWVGGEHGQMSFVEISVNDPVFWLHHAAIDRMWASWQKRWPGIQPPIHDRQALMPAAVTGVQRRIEEAWYLTAPNSLAAHYDSYWAPAAV